MEFNESLSRWQELERVIKSATVTDEANCFQRAGEDSNRTQIKSCLRDSRRLE